MIEIEEAEKISGYIGETITAALKMHVNGDFDVDHFIDEVEKEFKAYREEEEIAPLWGYGTYDDNEKKDDRELNPWGSPYGERPKIVECNGEQVAAELVGYRVCQLFPNRDNNTDYYVMFGTPSEIRMQAAIFLNLHKRLGGGGGDTNSTGGLVRLAGKPMIKLYFMEKANDVEPGWRPLKAEISLRLMEYTDDPLVSQSSNLKLIDNVALKALSVRIKSLFFPQQAFSFKKGKVSVSIKDRENGLESYTYCFSRSDGIELYTKMYDILEKPLDLKKIHISENADPATAYPIVPPEITVLGTTKRRKRKRPVGTVHFISAEAWLPTLAKSIPLVNIKGLIFDKYEPNNPDKLNE